MRIRTENPPKNNLSSVIPFFLFFLPTNKAEFTQPTSHYLQKITIIVLFWTSKLKQELRI
mgnify:CR=1 FL=1